MCKGRKYKLSIQYYMDNIGNITEKYVFRKLKKLSCAGCGCCGIFDEEFANLDKDRMFIVNEYVDGGIYQLFIVNESRDWESGIIDEWDVGMRLVEAVRPMLLCRVVGCATSDEKTLAMDGED